MDESYESYKRIKLIGWYVDIYWYTRYMCIHWRNKEKNNVTWLSAIIYSRFILLDIYKEKWLEYVNYKGTRK